MRAHTKEERHRFDTVNDAYTRAWKVDGEKVRDRFRRATSALHANPRDDAVVNEFLSAREEVKVNDLSVADLNEARSQVLKEIKFAIELEHHTTGKGTGYEKVTFVNGMKKLVPQSEVDGLRRKGFLKETNHGI